jgi:hypothetical protein
VVIAVSFTVWNPPNARLDSPVVAWTCATFAADLSMPGTRRLRRISAATKDFPEQTTKGDMLYVFSFT